MYHNGVIVMTLKLVHDLKMKSFRFAAKIGMSLLHMASGTLIIVTECLYLGVRVVLLSYVILHIPLLYKSITRIDCSFQSVQKIASILLPYMFLISYNLIT